MLNERLKDVPLNKGINKEKNMFEEEIKEKEEFNVNHLLKGDKALNKKVDLANRFKESVDGDELTLATDKKFLSLMYM